MDLDDAHLYRKYLARKKQKLEDARVSRDDPGFRVEICGKRFTLCKTGYRRATKAYPVRGVITTFSRRARAARLRRIAEVNWAAAGRGVFVTVTYPPELEDHTMGDRKTHRYLLNRSICQWAGRHLGCFWRVEWLPRKSGPTAGQLAPHMHFLYLSIDSIDQDFLAARWKEIIGAQRKVRVECQDLLVGDMVACYVSKYCSKEANDTELVNVPKRNRTGRHAGELRRALIPMHPLEVTKRIDEAIVMSLQRRACETLWWYDPRYDEGFTILGDEALRYIADFNQKSLDTGGESP